MIRVSDRECERGTARGAMGWFVVTAIILALGICVSPADASVKSVKASIRAAAKTRHCSKRDVRDLLWIAKRESSYRPGANNGRCHGIFQLSAGMAHGHPWRNVRWNTLRAIRYMRGRYGSIHKARLFWQRHHWY